jgi:P-type conjugative transfer protein TrbJ
VPSTQRLCVALPVITIALTSCLSRSAAQLTVFDPVNYQENLLSAARALQQINNQVRQLQGEAQMLARMEQNLVKLDGSIHPDLQRLLGAIQGHLQQGNAIALSLKATESSYERLFPRGLSQNLSGDARLRAAQERWEEEYAGLKRAAQLQGQIGDGIAVDSRLLGQAMDRSRVANGALEVAQAGNELTGLGVKQVLALQSLLAAQHRAETLKSARDLASEQEARQRFKTFLGPRTGERAPR